MSIENRDLKAGTKLVATYKKQEFSCEVAKTKDGVIYRLADGQEYKSLSSAGSAVMGGSACNGWRFWSLEGEAKPKSSAAPAKTVKAEQTIRPMKGDPTRFWCSACMDSFPVAEGETPAGCPQGHTNASAEAEAPKAAKKAPAKGKAKTRA
jgi:Restriction Enzyme Adenine Methylase Associated/Protein of unknown function (DUF2924)